ncbi:hypothetical protein TNCV_5030891 [Trichonephila clavipes]|nr:hypothetical protein TNCV_5030891 [Trichonephila clavipes]
MRSSSICPPIAAAIGNDFILMDDNARPHRARIVEEYLEDDGLERNGMASSIVSNPQTSILSWQRLLLFLLKVVT